MQSAYERERAQNILANQRKLLALGIGAQLSVRSAKRLRPSRADDSTGKPSAPARKSPRSSRLAEAVVPPPAPLRVREWWEQCFETCESQVPSNSLTVWDTRRHHQHLTRSPTGRVIATTGVAGYGAALTARVHRTKAPLSWEVKAVRFGVGGFGVGVARATMKPPFKSLGNHPDVVGVFLASGSIVSGGIERPFGPAYAPGDRIGVSLRREVAAEGVLKQRHELVFLLNGEEVGVAASGLGGEELVLAVQPYMGGVAHLLGA